ncbi:anthranilate synthase family protein [Chromobacterium sp. IIBBL 290-4]|uniref:anthranilate synthase family protein n=1 Tax=Chromobacterium sp. IIBBL 290-4 TaxID=2953890 RepID=UPI0020B6393F|nr:anthranilate synthase family protein [Chromobacterium sp. IIBBL 290-4]UTH76295.1 anthranilate synthase family protein [Chromobacterium sp. IIBBL 290-4]
MSVDLLDQALSGQASSFALLCRAGGAARQAHVDVIIGELCYPASLQDLPLRDAARNGGQSWDWLLLLPYRQILERGFACRDDGAPLLAIRCRQHEQLPVQQVLSRLPDTPTRLSERRFDIDDEAYARMVEQVLAEEIGHGAGSNFVIKRTLEGQLDHYSLEQAFSVFKRLLRQESGAHWIFLAHTPERTFIGATPERHLTLHDGVATMNPISGTYRYPQSGPTLAGIRAFLEDRKESDELYMVLDEELKMMTRLCHSGVRVTGPHLREMARLAHTEYFISGKTDADVRHLLRETLFAPTVTGSPIESAARVIARHEPVGRGYYSGIAALIGQDEQGGRMLDSSILIRTAEVSPQGRVRIGVGATLVRHSVPRSEVMETHSKVATLSNAFDPHAGAQPFGEHPLVREDLAKRNAHIADFWFRAADADNGASRELAGLRTLIIDAEDHFTAMIAHQLRALGLETDIRQAHEPADIDAYDVVVMGPGPGDPRALDEPRIGQLHAWIRRLLADKKPFVAVCLSHQVLSATLDIPLRQRATPNQGIQVEIDLFGQRERVGFYNAFAAYSARDALAIEDVGPVSVCRDPASGEVHALRGESFSSMQFHAESVLTVDGPRILAQALAHALRGAGRLGQTVPPQAIASH